MTLAAPLSFSPKSGIWGEKSWGVSEESIIIREKFNEFIKHDFESISRQRSDPEVKFVMLKTEWEADTPVLSSITEIALHPAYQQIIGMGTVAIPLILAELKRKPGHWFWALKAITGEDPVLPGQRGRIKEMTEAWLRWGHKQGYRI